MAAGGSGFEVCLGPGGAVQVVVADASGASVLTPSPGLSLDTANYHYVAVAADRDGQFTFCVDGVLGTCAAARPGSLDNAEAFTVGRRANAGSDFFQGQIDLIRVHRGRALSGVELQDNWQIIQGLANGSAYPEVGSGLGQYWAFLRLAEFFFLTNDSCRRSHFAQLAHLDRRRGRARRQWLEGPGPILGVRLHLRGL